MLVEEANSNSGQITTDKADIPFVCFICRINVLEAIENIQAHYGCYFYAVIYTRTGTLLRKGFEGRLTVIGIATFQKRTESDFDPPCCTVTQLNQCQGIWTTVFVLMFTIFRQSHGRTIRPDLSACRDSLLEDTLQFSTRNWHPIRTWSQSHILDCVLSPEPVVHFDFPLNCILNDARWKLVIWLSSWFPLIELKKSGCILLKGGTGYGAVV